jgi:hypothetical protein
MIKIIKKSALLCLLSMSMQHQTFASDLPAEQNTKKINACLLNHTNLETLRILFSLQAIISASALGYTLLTHSTLSPYENSLPVNELYPFAQEWYDAMAIKYPAAHLNTKSFKIAPFNHSFESSLTNIFFPILCIQDLDAIYEKQINGETLQDYETLFLYRLEYLVLHEAAHIENNDAIKRLISPIMLYLGAETLLTCCTNSSFHVNNIDWIRTKIENNNLLGSANTTAYLVATGLYLSYVAQITSNIFYKLVNTPYIRSQEAQADDFALQHGDMNALYGAVQFFQLSDNIERILQNPEHPDYQTALFFKNNPTWRWIIDTAADKDHPQPSARALKFQQEIERRLQNS